MGIFFFNPPKTAHPAYFFRLFSKTAKLCYFIGPHCILRWIWGSWTHFCQYFDMIFTFWLSTTPQSDGVAQKTHILAIFLTASSKGGCALWGDLCRFFQSLFLGPKALLKPFYELFWMFWIPTTLQGALGIKVEKISKFCWCVSTVEIELTENHA